MRPFINTARLHFKLLIISQNILFHYQFKSEYKLSFMNACNRNYTPYLLQLSQNGVTAACHIIKVGTSLLPLARPFKSRGNCPHWHLTTFRTNPIVPYSASLRLIFEQKKIRVANVQRRYVHCFQG